MDGKKTENTAKLIKHHRIRLNYTQQQLSDLSGISLRSLQRIENNQVIPRPSTLHLLAKHLEFELPFYSLIDEGESLKPHSNFKLILSFLIAAIMVSLSLAFIFQSPTFPESAFELSLFIAGVLVVYTAVLIKIWKK